MSDGERERLQVEHQLDVLLERVGHADRRVRQLARLAALCSTPRPSGCAARSRARRRGSRRAARGRRRRARRLQIADRLGDPVEDARSSCGGARRASRRRADAEQLIEHRARVANHRQRLGRRRPADRVGVDARVAVGAAARLIDVLDAQLHRRNRRVLAELLRVDLIERRAGEDVRALRLLRVRLREEHRRGAEVIAADLRRRERLGVADVGVADDGQVVAVRLERAQAGRRQVERRAGRRRRPHVLLEAERRCCRPRRAPSRWRRGELAARRLRAHQRPPAPSRRGTAARPSRPCPAAPCAARGASCVMNMPSPTALARSEVRPLLVLGRASRSMRATSLIWNAALFDDAEDERREPVVAAPRRRGRSRAPPACRRLDAAAERVGHQVLGEAEQERVLVLEQRLAQARGPVHRRAVVELARRRRPARRCP